MRYVYYYNVASIVLTSLILFIFLLRNKYYSKTNRIFLMIILCNLLASVFDLIRCFTTASPNIYPLWYNYFVSLGAILFYNSITLLFVVYVAAKSGIAKQYRWVRRICCILFLIYTIAICTSPWTRTLAYFDDNLTYHQGYLMTIFVLFPFMLFVWEIYIFCVAKNQFNKYQVIASIFMIATMAGSVVIGLAYPHLLTVHFTMALTIVFIYITYENPSYYCYLDTQCLNKQAFNEKLLHLSTKEKNLKGVYFTITNASLFQYYYSHTIQTKLLGKVADILFRQYRTRVYFLSDNSFFINTTKSRADVINQVWNLFAEPIEAESIRQRIELNFYTVDMKVTDVEDIELIIDNIDDNVDNNNFQQKLSLLKDVIVHKEEVLTAIKYAIQNDGFEVYFQPIRNLKTGRYDCAEALIRLFDEEIGFINPEELIVLSEQHGLINEVGEIVFRKVCKCIRDNNVKELGIQYIDVNLSPIQCMTPTLSDTLFTIMKEYDVEAHQINLEITETAKTEDNPTILKNIELLSNHGVKFSIDDYGSGFASANYLIKYPISYVKIDKQILWQAMKDETAMIVFKGTTQLLKQLNKKIVIEGGETQEMIDLLVNEGCDYCQGYFYSKPLPEEAFINFLQDNR